jgi:TatD DNase family protein
MFDTHAHVHDPAFDADRDEMLARARAAGITRIMTIGTDLEDSRRAQATALARGIEYAIGIHPHEAKDAPSDIAVAFDALVASAERPPLAIGEMGLDFHYDHSPREAQQRVLEAQLAYAQAHDLPAVFHVREAFDPFFAILRERGEKQRGIVHCFTGDATEARTAVEEFGLSLGIGGVVTFKNAQKVRDAVLAVGLGAIVLETDCPYLAPVPHRSERNEPAFMLSTARFIAELFGTTLEDVRTRTTANADALFEG